MWSPVAIVFLLASVRADADADADADPYVPLRFTGSSWAAQLFAPQEDSKEPIARDPQPSPAENFGFQPAYIPQSPIFAVRDVRGPPPFIMQLKQQAQTHGDMQVVQRPVYFPPPSPFFLQTIHLAVPSKPTQDKVPVSVPVQAPAPSFISQHTAQIPFFSHRPAYPTIVGHIPIPIAGPPPAFFSRHTAQARPMALSMSAVDEDMDEDEDDDVGPNYIMIPHFPTSLPSLMSLRGMADEEPVIPAGIVQATQPTFTRVEFVNDKAHPSLHNKKPAKDSGVITI